MASDRPLRIFLSAGESSGDILGARLMLALQRQSSRPIIFQGIGGPAMETAGLNSLFPMSELALMGLVEILPHIPRLKRRIAEARSAVMAFDPDVMLTIDAPGFNKRLASACGRTRFPKIHYVAPTVWAWRPKRVHAFKKRFERLLCLLPFEPPYFQKVGLDAVFVGHPVLESGADCGDGPGFRDRYGISKAAELICVLPGSRRGEIQRLLPDFQKTLERLAADRPNVQFVIPCVDHLAEEVQAAAAKWSVPGRVLKGAAEKYDAMAASSAALAASGTVALELAMAAVPTVVAYRMNPLTFRIVQRLVRVSYVHLLNLLARRAIVPERLQTDCTPEILAADLNRLLSEDGAAQVTALQEPLNALRPESGQPPSQEAAAAVLSMIGQ